MVEKNAQEDASAPFKVGDVIVIVAKMSRHNNRRGAFLRYWSDKYYFARGRACDVEIEGEIVAMSVADLELVVEK